ncbi:MAG: nucleotidyltransferase domain-containing protein [Terriglobia bacterium]|jgi:predicted nucleotidyltransferase
MRKSATLNALFPGVRQGILAWALGQPEKWWYLSELAKILETSPSSLQRELASLVDIGMLEQRRDGRRTYFRAAKRFPIFRELRRIFEKTAGAVPILRELLNHFGKSIVVAFIYGSVARAEEHALSDIDLMVIGAVGLSELTPALRAAEKHLGREVNATVYSVGELRKQVGRDNHFLTEVLKMPKQFVKGSSLELEELTR